MLGLLAADARRRGDRRRHAPVGARRGARCTRSWSARRRCRSSVLAAPLILLLGFGLAPKVVIVALVCFFPVTVNLFDGLRAVDAEQRKLLRSLHASRRQTLLLLEAPAALPAGVHRPARRRRGVGDRRGVRRVERLRERARPPACSSRSASWSRRAPSRPPSCSSLLAVVLYGAFSLAERRSRSIGRHETPAPPPAAAGPARRLRGEVRAPADGGDAGEAHGRPGLPPQRRPRPDLRGAGERRVRARGPRRQARHAERPVRAAAAAGGQARRPGAHLRARADPRPRQGHATSSASARSCRSR